MANFGTESVTGHQNLSATSNHEISFAGKVWDTNKERYQKIQTFSLLTPKMKGLKLVNWHLLYIK